MLARRLSSPGASHKAVCLLGLVQDKPLSAPAILGRGFSVPWQEATFQVQRTWGPQSRPRYKTGRAQASTGPWWTLGGGEAGVPGSWEASPNSQLLWPGAGRGE